MKNSNDGFYRKQKTLTIQVHLLDAPSSYTILVHLLDASSFYTIQVHLLDAPSLYTIQVHLLDASSSIWSPGCSFSFVYFDMFLGVPFSLLFLF